MKRLADLQELLLAGLQVGDHCVRIDLHAQSLKEFPGFRLHALLIKSADLVGILPVQEHVLKYFEVIEQVEFLMNECDTHFFGLCDRYMFQFLSVKFNCSAVFRQYSGENVHQRRLSRAVLAQKSMHLAFLDCELYTLQNGNAAERLAYISHFQQTHMVLLPNWDTSFSFLLLRQKRPEPSLHRIKLRPALRETVFLIGRFYPSDPSDQLNAS